MSNELTKFDFRAVAPTSEKTFMQSCSTLDIDIISFEMTEKLPYMLKRTYIGTAIERGIHFEIKYSPAIRDSSLRQNTISNARMLVSLSKGKNIILSSGCETPLELRSPQDVANLALLFGLTPKQAKDAVSTNYQKLISKSRSRKTASCAISLTTVAEMPEEDWWKIPKLNEEEDESIDSDICDIENSDDEKDTCNDDARNEHDISNSESRKRKLSKSSNSESPMKSSR